MKPILCDYPRQTHRALCFYCGWGAGGGVDSPPPWLLRVLEQRRLLFRLHRLRRKLVIDGHLRHLVGGETGVPKDSGVNSRHHGCAQVAAFVHNGVDAVRLPLIVVRPEANAQRIARVGSHATSKRAEIYVAALRRVRRLRGDSGDSVVHPDDMLLQFYESHVVSPFK